MTQPFRYSIPSLIVGLVLATTGCTSSVRGGVTDDSDGVAALVQAGAIERLVERTAPNIPPTAIAPSFVADPGWPKVLPNDWILGQIGGIFVDRHDNIWVYHRPRSFETRDVGSLNAIANDAQGRPINGLGHPRPYSHFSDCCTPAPSVVQFDREGNLIRAWGGPTDPGFLETKCRAEDGCDWPAREHGIFVDHNDFVYVAGNGQANQWGLGQFPWAATFGDDSHVLKFTADGDFIYQIGYPGVAGPNSDDTDGGPNGTPQPYLAADMTVDPATNRLYIADGYGNRRIIIADAETGRYIGHFGAYGANPVGDPDTVGDSYDSGPWLDDFYRGELRPKFFRVPVHCVKITGDGLLYVCDRGNNRVQVFNAAEVGQPCLNPEGEAGRCGFVSEVLVAPQTGAGTAGALSFSTDLEESCVYMADLTNNTIWVVNRENLHEIGRIGRSGRQIGEFHWVHTVSNDSEGNLYTGEVDTASRVQKLVRYGATACSGTGNPEVGQ